MATTDQRLAAAMAAASVGLRIVMLKDHNGDPELRKHGRFYNWGHKATDDEDTLVALFEHHPHANIGVKLGPYPAGSKIPGVIDVEFDCEEGRITAERIFGNNTFTPTYKSARSVHRLFLWDDDFPPMQKLHLEGLEVRLGGDGKQTQSVLPPSTHKDGREYQWLPGLSIDDVELAKVPNELAVQLCNVESRLEAEGLSTATGGGEGSKPPEYWESVKDGVAEGSRNETLLSLAGRWARNMVEVDKAELKERAIQWGKTCKPTLEAAECITVANNVVKRELNRRKAEADFESNAFVKQSAVDQVANTSAQQATVDANSATDKRLMGCVVTKVTSEPPEYVFSFNGQDVRFAKWSPSANQLDEACADQLNGVLPQSIIKKWKFLRRALALPGVMQLAKPKAEDDVFCSIASLIVPKIRRVRTSPAMYENQSRIETDGFNPLIRVADSVWVAFDRFHSDLAMENIVKEMTRKRLSAVLSRAGAVSAIEVIGDGETRTRRRFWRIDDAILAKLEAIALGEE